MRTEVSAVGVLGLCSDLIEMHRGGRAPRVIPVLLAPWATWSDLVAAAVDTEDGAVVVESDFTLGCTSGVEDIETELAPLVAAVRAELPKLGLDLELLIEGDHVRVERRDTPTEALNAASQVLCGAISALFAPELRDQPMCLLVVRDGELDLEHSSCLWSLFARLPELLDWPAGRTLVTVGQDSKLDVERHCAGKLPVLFDLNDQRYLRRQSRAESDAAVQTIVDFPKDQCPLIVVFVGAGVSVARGLPTGNELRNAALRTYLNVPAGETVEAAEMAGQFYDRLASTRDRLRPDESDRAAFISQLTLERVLREESHVQNLRFSTTLQHFKGLQDAVIAEMAPDACVTPLARLAKLKRRVVIVTVNFDQILEHDAGDLVQPFVTNEELGRLGAYLDDYIENGGAVPYIKLHGDVDNVASIVATIDETAGGLSPARAQAIRTLRYHRVETPLVRPWIYVGYSMRDLDVNEVIGTSEFATDLVEYWVNPLSDPAIADFIATGRATAWSRKNLQYTAEERTITIPADEFLDRLAAGMDG